LREEQPGQGIVYRLGKERVTEKRSVGGFAFQTLITPYPEPGSNGFGFGLGQEQGGVEDAL